MECRVANQSILLLLYGELDPVERLEVERHVEACHECSVALAEERRLRAILDQRPVLDPTAELLNQCRRDLAEAITPSAETAITRGRGKASPGWLLAWPHRLWTQARISPAFASALLVVGFLAGFLSVSRLGPSPPDPSSTPIDMAAGGAINLRSIEEDPASDRIFLKYDATERTSLRGTLDDPRVRDLLVSALQDNHNAGLRLDAIDILQRRADDPEVRAALMEAIGDDANPAARLRAIEALDRRAETDAGVREAVIRALLQDRNPGVRVRAFDALARVKTPETIPLFERLAREDSNEYVRMRSAAVVDALYRPEGTNR
jgi:hypothetical protein